MGVDRVPDNAMKAGTLPLGDQDGDALSHQIEDLQLHLAIRLQAVGDDDGAVEGIWKGIVEGGLPWRLSPLKRGADRGRGDNCG